MRFDLHVHTYYSRCSNLRPSTILRLAKKLNLSGIAITDHNTASGAFMVKRMNKDKDLEIIPGMELRTKYGELLVYYIKEEIGSRDLFEILDIAKSNDYIVALPHPRRFLHHLSFHYPVKDIKNRIHAIETYNARSFWFENNKAKKLAESLDIAQIAGSDAHFTIELGKGITLCTDDLRKAIKNKTTEIEKHYSYHPFPSALSTIIKRLG